MLHTQNLFRFSQSTLAAKTFAKYAEKLTVEKNHLVDAIEAAPVKKSTQRAYVHPYHNNFRRINVSTREIIEAADNLVGVQQVSTHFEHFSFSRRWLIASVASFFVLRFFGGIHDAAMILESLGTFMAFGGAAIYFYAEWNKYYFAEGFNRFYRHIAANQIINMQTYWSQNMQVRVRNMMAKNISQFSYSGLQEQYTKIKNHSLVNFLIYEQIALKNHLNTRAEAIFKEVQTIEKFNYNLIVSNVMRQTLNSIDIAYKNNKAKIESEMFTLALEGIANNRMDYSKDPILPYIVETINQTVQKFTNIPKEEQDKLIALTDAQIEAIRNKDIRQRDEFLNNPPKIEGTLRTSPVISKIIDSWGTK